MRTPVDPALGQGLVGGEPGGRQHAPSRTDWTSSGDTREGPAGSAGPQAPGSPAPSCDSSKPQTGGFQRDQGTQAHKHGTTATDHTPTDFWSPPPSGFGRQGNAKDNSGGDPLLASKMHDAGRVTVILLALYLLYKTMQSLFAGISRLTAPRRSQHEEGVAATTKTVHATTPSGASPPSRPSSAKPSDAASSLSDSVKDFISVYSTVPAGHQLATAPDPRAVKDSIRLSTAQNALTSEDEDDVQPEERQEEPSRTGDPDASTESTKPLQESPAEQSSDSGDTDEPLQADERLQPREPLPHAADPALTPNEGVHPDLLESIADLLPKTERDTPLTPAEPVNEPAMHDSSPVVCIPSAQDTPSTVDTPLDQMTRSSESAQKALGSNAQPVEATVSTDEGVDKTDEDSEPDEEEPSDAADAEELALLDVFGGRFGAALKELYDALGPGKLDLELDARQDRQKDAWSHHTGVVPYGIIYPESTEDVSTMLRICNKHRLPVIAYGCGTSLEGHTVDTVGGVVCNMGRMAKIIKFRPEDSDITVETGIQWMTVNEALEASGLFFPMDPGPEASIGGMIGTCCSGTNAVRYGVMRDWILKIKVVLADGTVTELGSRARKDTAGYDLVRLFTGAEGTLGIVTEATLRVTPRPENELAAICAFPTTKDACAAVAEVIRRGTQVLAAEYLDPLAVAIMNTDAQLGFQEAPSIMFKFGGTRAHLEETQMSTQQICVEHKGQRFQSYDSQENGAEFERFWSARKNLLYTAIGWAQDRESWITDVCVPLGKLADVMQETIDDLKKSPLDAPVFGHVGDGNFHATILYHPDRADEAKEVEELNRRIVFRAIEAEGTCTGEHGVGMGKREYLKKQVSPVALEIMKKIKTCLDPNGILNPNKIFTEPHPPGTAQHTGS